VALPAGFRLRALDGVGLQEGIQVALLAPVATVVVVLDLSRGQIADSRIASLRQLHGETGGGIGKQSVCALDRLRKAKTLARGTHGRRVSDFTFDPHNV